MNRVPVLLALTLLLVACGGGELSSTTLGPAVTTTLPPFDTTTTKPPTVATPLAYSVGTAGFLPEPLSDSETAQGSGCVVSGDGLPDGMWFGYVEAMSTDTVIFDLACFYTGGAAVAAAAEDGEEAFDFYIRNENPDTRSVPIDLNGIAHWLDGAGDLTPQAMKMSSWPIIGGTAYQACPGDFCGVWLYVNDGVATELVEQYLP